MQNNSVPGGGQNSTNQGAQVPKQGGLSWSQPATTGNKPVIAGGAPVKPATPVQTTQKNTSVPAYMQANKKPKTGNKKFFGILASGVLIGFLVGWAWFASRTEPTEKGTVTTTGQETTTTGSVSNTTSTNGAYKGGQAAAVVTSTAGIKAPGVTAPAGDFVTVASPQAPGTRVTISGLKVSQPTWVVVYDNKNGVRGNALGAALFFPTTPHSSATIGLLRGTVAGSTYLIGRNVDNGNKIFSLQEDGPIVDTAGKPVYQTLEVRN